MNEAAKTFEDLKVWKKSHELVLDIYRTTRQFPKDETFALTSQIRRAAVSTPSNIVEGFNRRGKADKLKFYNYSEASVEEVRYQLLLAHDLEYADTRALQDDCREVYRMITAYAGAIRKD